jgi:hypothetical protein
MKMNFYVLVEKIMSSLLEESFDIFFVKTINSEIDVIKGIKDFKLKKNALKEKYKSLTYHLLNSNYENVLKNNFPDLRPKSTDAEFEKYFHEYLVNNPPAGNSFKKFISDIDNIILKLGNRNNQQLGNLLLLRSEYLIQYGDF